MNAARIQHDSWFAVRGGVIPPTPFSLDPEQLPTSAIQHLETLGFERFEIYASVLPVGEFARRVSKNEPLTPAQSDRVRSILHVLATAEFVYSTRERALAWLRRPNPRLADKIPLELSRTSAGRDMVEELLGQIDEGIFI